MNKVSRRTALAAAGFAFPSALTVNITEAAVAPEPVLIKAAHEFSNGPVDLKLIALIEAHKVAYAAFIKACRGTDSVALGREPNEKEQAIYDETNDAEEEALDAILELPPVNKATAIAKIEYVTLPAHMDDISTSHHYDRTLLLLWSFAGGMPDQAKAVKASRKGGEA